LGSGNCGACDLYPLEKLVARCGKPCKAIDEQDMIWERGRETEGVVDEEGGCVCIGWEVRKVGKIRFDINHF